MHVIDLDKHTGNGRVHNLAGKRKGLDVRTSERLDELDNADAPVQVIVPKHLYALSPSFFLGLFSRSLRHFESKEAFLAHYKFIGTEQIKSQVHDGIADYFSAKDAIDVLLSEIK